MAAACAPFRVLDGCARIGVVRHMADLTRALRHAGFEPATWRSGCAAASRTEQRAEHSSLHIARATRQGQAPPVRRVFFTQEEARHGCISATSAEPGGPWQPWHLFWLDERAA